MSAPKHVLAGNANPRRLHHTTCWHPPVSAPYRTATKQERRTLPPCFHCVRRGQ